MKPVSFTVDALNPELCVTVPITITANGHQITTTALLDSGAAGNFMSNDFALHNCIALIKCSSSLTVEAIDGRPLGSGHISSLTQELLMQTGLFHTEKIQFYILPTSNTPVILGLPWLHRHDPHVSWKEGQITQWNDACYPKCLSHISSLPVRSIKVNKSPPNINLPEENRDLSVAFSKVHASKLLPHRAYDCAIDLIPGSTP